jgi:integrase
MDPNDFDRRLERLNNIVKRARIDGHSFRHSRATWLANKLTEAQMKEHFGWTQSSDHGLHLRTSSWKGRR